MQAQVGVVKAGVCLTVGAALLLVLLALLLLLLACGAVAGSLCLLALAFLAACLLVIHFFAAQKLLLSGARLKLLYLCLFGGKTLFSQHSFFSGCSSFFSFFP